MNLRQVEAFRAVMLTGRMTAAAELMSVTQSAISRLIRDFEYATKLSLFTRRGNQIVPTEAALTLLREVERAFVGLSRIEALAAEIGRHNAGQLRISAMPALANGVMPSFVARFLRARPNVHLSLRGIPSSMAVEAVASGQVDIGFADMPLERPGYRSETYSMPAIVALPQSHRLAGHAVITPHDLADERMILLEPGPIFGMRVEVALAGIPRQASLETTLTHTALTLVAEGAGVAIIDPLPIPEFRHRGVITRPFSEFIEAGFVAVQRSDAPENSLLEQFKDDFRSYFKTLLLTTQ
ncbi:LysR family transcriptional regulator [Brucella intermedia]|uniref:LysR family transcriptional regulator n=1 Tax=Brucella intermedia TaxID=94625 RepID=UPI0022488D67|nr:LysR family transcriptional regulator [Brucella intermedia]